MENLLLRPLRARQDDYRDTRSVFVILGFTVKDNEILAIGYRENSQTHHLETEPIDKLCILDK